MGKLLSRLDGCFGPSEALFEADRARHGYWMLFVRAFGIDVLPLTKRLIVAAHNATNRRATNRLMLS